MPKTIEQWLQEGEQLHTVATEELKAIQTQLQTLEQQLASKQSEVTRLSRLLGKAPTVTGPQPVAAEEQGLTRAFSIGTRRSAAG